MLSITTAQLNALLAAYAFPLARVLALVSTAPVFGNPERQAPSTMVGVTRLSNPDFLVEVDLLAIAAE